MINGCDTCTIEHICTNHETDKRIAGIVRQLQAFRTQRIHRKDVTMDFTGRGASTAKPNGTIVISNLNRLIR
jgi:hypothetical protein